MNTEIAIEKMVKVLPVMQDLIVKIKDDKEMLKIFEEVKNGKATNLDIVFKFIPLILTDAKDETLAVLAAFSDKTLDAVKKQDVKITISDLKSLLTEADLMAFFS